MAYTTSKKTEDKSNKFIAIVAVIGSVLIFIGLAWLIASNWRYIPDFIKVLIMVVSTIASFVIGVKLRQDNNEAVGRSLIALGALLYILTLGSLSYKKGGGGPLTNQPQQSTWYLYSLPAPAATARYW